MKRPNPFRSIAAAVCCGWLFGAPPGLLAAGEVGESSGTTPAALPAIAPAASAYDRISSPRSEKFVQYDLTDEAFDAESFEALLDPPATTASPNGTAPQKTPVASLPPMRGRVVKVVDGDTYVLEDKTRIRQMHVNTPEKSERVGMAVKQRMRQYLLDQDVTLELGPTPKDGYGRVIADVHVEGTSVVNFLLENGLAHLFIIPPSRPAQYEELLEIQRKAREQRVGIWSEEHYQGVLHITSFHANARGDDRTNISGEYLRIANTSGHDLNIAGYSLTTASGRKLVFPDFLIPAGYTFQVVSGKGSMQGSQTSPYRIFWNSDGPVWNNERDVATLYDPDGRKVDWAEHLPKRSKPTLK